MTAIVEGKFYSDRFKTDPLWHGPMRKVTHGSMEMWLDQWGANYLRDGTHWGHTPESASNLDMSTARAALKATPFSSERASEIIDMLIEARNQIEYLHGKFKETASGNAVMVRLDDLRHKLQAQP